MENKKLGYAIIGAGGFSRLHTQELCRINDAEVRVVCDYDLEKAKKLADEFYISDYCTDHNEAVSRDDVDIVIVGTNDQTHCEATIAALKAGKHVLCEKPMALHREECNKMVEAADEAGKLLMVGQVCRCTPAFIKAKQMLEEGVIGELFYIESEYAHDYSKILGTNEWRKDKDRHPVIGGACHAIDLVRWIVGNPTEVSAFSNHKVLTDWPIDDCTIAIMKFPNDVVGKVFNSIGCKRDYTMRTCLYGSKGTIVCSNTDTHITLYLENNEDSVPQPDMFTKSVRHMIPCEINNHNVYEENVSFIDSVKNGTPLVTSGREGANTIAVCLSVIEAAQTGKIVKIKYDY